MADSLADFMLGEQRQARAAVSGAFDSSPDDAARALELSQVSGVPAPAIHMDLDNFEHTYKSSLATELLNNNSHLQDYVNSHPLAAAVSHDDLGQLDKVSSSLQTFGKKGFLDDLKDFAGDAIESVTKPFTGTFEQSESLSKAAHDYMLQQGIEPGAAKREANNIRLRAQRNELIQGALFAIPQLLLSPLSAATRQYVSRPLEEQTGFPKEATEALMLSALTAAGLIGSYVKAGKTPPTGIHPEIDKLHVDQAKTDAKNLDDVYKEVQGSATQGRSPEMMANFIRQHPESVNIEVPAEAIRKLYGDAEPMADDNKLGWVPDLQMQLLSAEPVGGDVTIPLADWLTKVTPEVAEALHDDLRLRPDGLTLNEAKELPKVEEPTPVAPAKEPPERPYKGVPDSLMGFTKSGRARDYYDSKYPFEQHVEVTLDNGDKFVDAIRGLNSKHAMERAYRNWQTEDIRPITREEALKDPEFRAANIGIDPIQDVVENIRGTNGWDYQDVRPEPAMGAYSLAEPKEVELRHTGKVSSIGTTTVKKALSELDLNLIEDKARGVHARNLQDIANVIKKAVGDTPIHIVADEDFQSSIAGADIDAYYDPIYHHIIVPESTYYGKGAASNTHAALHEAVHAATLRELESNQQLKRQVRSVMDDVKSKIPGIEKEYGFSDEHEFLAEALSNKKFQAKLLQTRLEPDLARRLGIEKWRNVTQWDALVHFIRFAFNLPKEAVTAFESVLKITEQAIEAPISKEYFAQVEKDRARVTPSTEVAGVKREEPPPFEGRAIGTTKADMAKMRKLLDKFEQGLKDAQFERGKRLEEKRQTNEWRENEKQVRQEARDDISSRPDIVASTFFGERSGPKINPDFLDDQQKAGLPKSMLSRSTGLDPDQVAREFGYQTGDEMIEKISRLHQMKGEQSLSSYIDQLVRDETDKRMRYKYGDLGENILEEAQDHVLGLSHMELMHEQLIQMAHAAGFEPKLTDGSPFTKENVERLVKQTFNESKVGTFSVEKYISKAGKNNRLAKLAESPVELLKYKQQEYLQASLAREALKFQKEQKQLQKTAKTYSKAEVAGIAPQFLNYVHDIMTRTGLFVNRSLEHIQQGIEMHGYGNLEDFYKYQNEIGLPESYKEYDVTYTPRMPVAEMLFDKDFREPIDQMSVGEFRAVHNSLKALIKIGRDEARINREGATEDKNIVIGKMVEQLKTQGEKPIYYPEQAGAFSKLHHFGQRMFAGLLQLEALWDRLDRADPEGIFTKWIGRPFAKAGNEFSALQREFSAKLAKLEDKVKLQKLIPNELFVEPLTWDTGNEIFRPITRENFRKIMLNMGNPSNLDILVRGHRVDKAQLLDWVNKYSTKEDWDYVQGIWNIYKDIKAKEDKMTEHLSGTTIEDIPTHKIETQFGTYDGGYFPVHPDRTNLREGEKKILSDASMYLRPATSRGWEIKRTGWAGPLDLSMSNIPQDISRRLKDLAFREVITNAAKIMLDKQFRAAMTKYQGQHITDLLHPYLKDMAGQVGITPANTQAAIRVIEATRARTVATLVGFNIGTFLKHTPTAMANTIGEVGILPFAEWMLKTWADPTMNNYRWVMEGGKIGKLDWKGSQEIQRRMQHFEETLGGVNDIIMGKPTLSLTMMQWGSKLVAVGDLASTIPGWYAKYVPEMKKNMLTMPIEDAHTLAVEAADKFVRFGHGTTVITSRPEFARGGVAARGAMSLYGTFNHIMNRNYYIGWRAKDMVTGRSPYPTTTDLAELSNKLLWYSVVPIAATSLASAGLHKEGEPWWKSALHIFGGQIPIVREFVSAFSSGHDPSVGIWGASYKAVGDIGRDVIKTFKGKQDTGAVLEHAITMAGVARGLGAEQVGKWTRFIYNYNAGKEHPRGFGDWYRGFRRGTIKEIK